jgi:hypothetical protein
MEKIKVLNLQRLHNEEHYNFLTDLNGLILDFTPEVLKVSKHYNLFEPIFESEAKALVFVSKNSYTKQLAEADQIVDNTLDGLGDAIKTGTKHFNAEVKAAANRLMIFWESFGNIARKSYDKESADVSKLLSELKGDRVADVTTVKLIDWVSELERNQTNFTTVRNSKYDEDSNKTRLRMKQVRAEADTAYEAIVERINAMITLEDEYDFTPFVTKLNLRIDHYTKSIAQRKGRNQDDSAGTDSTGKE